MHRPTLECLAIAVVLLSAAPAAAQDLEPPRPRQGYYFALGAHGAVQQLRDRDEDDTLGTYAGASGSLRFGQLLTPRFGLGLQFDAGGSSKSGQSSNLIGLGVAAQLEAADNLALHAGVGLGVVRVAETEEMDELAGYGAAYTFGITYDWFFTDRQTGGWAITPGLRARALPADPLTSFAGFVGVEISYWSGLPRRQLALSTDEAFTE